MKLINNLLIFCFLISISKLMDCAEPPATMQIQATIYDQHPFFNDNFEPENGQLTKGLVKPTIKIDNSNRIPELKLVSSTDSRYAINEKGRIYSDKLFQYFYKQNQLQDNVKNSGKNIPIVYNITLTRNNDNGVYEFSDQSFFPIDNKGFDDPAFISSNNVQLKKYDDNYGTGKYHNYHFCLKINSRFTYQKGLVFKFTGDDDVWVYINDVLAIDLGGLHQAESDSIDLDNPIKYIDINGKPQTMTLTVGESYSFDFFYCERHTTYSTIKISNSLLFDCIRDYCGVCGGSGDTCCNAQVDCNDYDLCTDDFCPPLGTKFNPSEISKYCTHQQRVDSSVIGDKCKTSTCDKTTGKFNVSSIVCQPKDCKDFSRCTPEDGCLYKPKCNDVCHLPGQCNGGQCVVKPPSTCEMEMNNGKLDPCYNYECKLGVGCTKTEKCPQLSNVCEINFCHPENGTCGITTLKPEECNCDCKVEVGNNKCLIPFCDVKTGGCAPKNKQVSDGNACTKDVCDPATGNTISTINVICDGCATCNSTTGVCDSSNSNCDDSNACTDNVCTVTGNNGTCSSTPALCQQTEICKVYSCNETTGCVSTDRVCPDIGNCQIGYCDPVQGCLTKPRECPASKYFCINTVCDEMYGCIEFEKTCAVDNSRCEKGICVNNTDTEKGYCDSVDYDPKPFICKTAAVVSTAVVAGVVVAGAVALAAAIFGGKKGYDYWKTSQGNAMAASNANPLYEASPNGGENPLFQNPG